MLRLLKPALSNASAAMRCMAIVACLAFGVLPGWAIEKSGILHFADAVVVGTAGPFRRWPTIYAWQWATEFRTEIDVTEVLKGPAELHGKQIPFVFRCCDCRISALWERIPDAMKRPGLWFLRHDGSGWEAAFGCWIDPGFRSIKDREYFQKLIRGEPVRDWRRP